MAHLQNFKVLLKIWQMFKDIVKNIVIIKSVLKKLLRRGEFPGNFR